MATDLSQLSDDDLLRLFQSQTQNLSAGDLMPDIPGVWQPVQAGIIGAGRAMDQLLRGGRDLYQRAMGDPAAVAGLRTEQQAEDKVYAPLQQQFPIATALGEATPALAASIAVGGTPSLFGGMLRQGLATGLTEAAKYGTPQERMIRGGVGAGEGALGALAGWGIGKAITPLERTPQAASPQAVAAADRLGVNLTAGQITGDIPLRRQEMILAQRAGSAGTFAKMNAKNVEAIDRAAAGALGEEGSMLDTGVFAAARQRISGDFNRLTKGTNVKLGQDFLDDLIKVEQEHLVTPPSLRSPQVPNVIDDMLDIAKSGNLAGETYQATRSRLGKLARDAFQSGNSQLGQALDGITEALDNAAGKTLTRTEQAAWAQARAQWKALRTLEEGNVVTNAHVNPLALKAAVQRRDPILYKEGRLEGPLADIARYAEGVRALPDSGTPGGFVAAQGTQSPAGLFRNLAGSPYRWMMAKATTSPLGKSYLTNQAMTDEARRLLMQSGGLLGLGFGPGYVPRYTEPQ